MPAIQLDFERGGLDRWERPLRVALNRHPESRWFLRTWQALAYCELDRDEEAATIFDELAAKDFADLTFEPVWLYMLCNNAAVCAHLGDAGRALTLLELIRPYDGQLVTMSSLAYSGAVSHHLGVLARTMGRHDDAERWLAAAAEVHERIGAPGWLARTRLESAVTLLEVGGRDPEAASLLAGARATATGLGMPAVERRAASLLRD